MTLKELFAKLLHSKKAQPVSAEPAPRPTPSAPPPKSKEFCPKPDFHDPVYHALAGLCALGDIAAMWEMAHWHRSHLRASTEQLLAAYESGEDTYSQLWERRHYNSPDANPLCYYVTWIGLAARYGHPEAQRIIQGRVFFKYASIIKEKITQVGGISSALHSSVDLNRMGMTAVDINRFEFGLRPLTMSGVYPASYLADYIPADSDGFGREDEYEDIFYDEFFCQLLAHNMAGAEQLAERNRQRREEYWADPAHDPDNRKYRQLWSEMPLDPDIVKLWKYIKPAPPAPPVVYASYPDYYDPVYRALTRLCGLGDIIAMWDLANWHRRCLSPAAEQLLAAYERDGKGYETLCAACPPDAQDGKSLNYYVTWICQAARYGHAEAGERIRNRVLFRDRGTLPPAVHQVGTQAHTQLNAPGLYYMGIPEAQQIYDYADVCALSTDGIFVFCYVSSYGSDPKILYFDEFFCKLPARTPGEATELAKQNHLRRERYWADPAHSPETRKYRNLLCDFSTTEE